MHARLNDTQNNNHDHQFNVVLQMALRKLYQQGPYWSPNFIKKVDEIQTRRIARIEKLNKDKDVVEPKKRKCDQLSQTVKMESLPLAKMETPVRNWFRGEVVNVKVKRGKKSQDTGTNPHDAPVMDRLKRLFNWEVQIRGGRPQDSADVVRQLISDKDVVRFVHVCE